MLQSSPSEQFEALERGEGESENRSAGARDEGEEDTLNGLWLGSVCFGGLLHGLRRAGLATYFYSPRPRFLDMIEASALLALVLRTETVLSALGIGASALPALVLPELQPTSSHPHHERHK